MPGRLCYEDVKTNIEKLGCELLSKNYVNSKTPLNLKCGKCNDVYYQTYDRVKTGYIHPGCRFTKKGFDHINESKQKRITTLHRYTCPHCSNVFYDQRKNRVYCSNACFHTYQSKSEKWVEYGSKGGKLATSNSRSKNEIEFYNLCVGEWGEEKILTNESIFDGFDADIIIPHINSAIEWNGIWHYKKVKSGHKLKQIQARDKVKSSIITKKYGYKLYVIKDMGKHDVEFVKERFEEFLIHSASDKDPKIYTL